MFRDVILPDQTAEDWERLRPGVLKRVKETMGEEPAGLPELNVQYLAEENIAGLKTKSLRYEAIPGTQTHGQIVFPPNYSSDNPAPAVICMHGTDYKNGFRNQIMPDEKPHRAYAIEMAKRGYVTLTVDLLGFGAGNAGKEPKEVYKAFYEQYPDWSLDGARLRIHQLGLSLLTSQPGVDPDRLGCIGHSLGGRSSVYLAAFDERIGAAVVSSGVSPNLTNVFRNPTGYEALSRRLNEKMFKDGRPPFEYQEMLALIAPRMLVLLEPWDDNCNPMIEPTTRCFEKARWVYKALDAGKNCHYVMHGDGHDTQPEIRSLAYQMIGRVLRPTAPEVEAAGV